MTEAELRQLKDLPVPPPREGAREAAVAVALAALQPATAADRSGAPQEIAVPPRLRSTSSISKGNSKMVFRSPAAIAASIITLAIVVPATLHLTRAPTHDVAPRRSVRHVATPPMQTVAREASLPRVVEWDKGPSNAPSPVQFGTTTSSR